MATSQELTTRYGLPGWANPQEHWSAIQRLLKTGQISVEDAITALGLVQAGAEQMVPQWMQAAGLTAPTATTASATGTPAVPSSLQALIEGPQELGSFIEGTPYSLPGSDVAATGLRGLQTAGLQGLLDFLVSGGDEARRQAVEDALFEKTMEDINRANTDLRQEIRESNFARGMGSSTVTGDDLGRLERERLDAVGQARREAVIASGEEARAADAARLSALGQAFGQGTTGLQAEANVGLTTSGRGQQARQSAAQIGSQGLLSRLTREQQGEQFGRELESREKLFEEGRESAETIASENRLAAGIGGGISGVANVFAPTLNSALQRLFGLG